MIITHKLQPMDLTHKQNTIRVDVVQDDKYSRDIEFKLTENGVAWQIPDGTTAVVRYKKPDGTGGNYDTLPDGSTAYQINGNVLTVALAPQVCTVQGPVQLSVGIIHGSAEINTFSVNIVVHPNPGAEYQSEDYIRLSGAVPNSGWTPNMYLVTDASGNVVAKEGTSGGGETVSIDSTLTKPGQAADAAEVGNKINELNGDLTEIDKDIYEITFNKFDYDNVLYNKMYILSSSNSVRDSDRYNLTELIDVSDYGGADLWFKAYGFTDYSIGYTTKVYCFDNEGAELGEANTTTVLDASFSGEPYRCKVFNLLEGTKKIRVQYSNTLNDYNIGLFYSFDWNSEYVPHKIIPFIKKDAFDIGTTKYYDHNSNMNVASGTNALGTLSVALNSALLNEAAKTYRAKLYSGKFSHDGTMVVDSNGNGYVAYVANAVDTGDSPTSENAITTLAKIDLKTLSISSKITNFEVCKRGDIVEDKTILSGVGVPNCVIDGNIIYIIFSAKLSDNKWYLLRREYNTTTSTFGNIEICTLNGNNFTTDKINEIISLVSTNHFISMNAQIAKTESMYYAGVNVGNYISSGFIVSSSNLKDFTTWYIPNVENSVANFECPCYVKDGYLYYAIRQNDINKMILLKISLSNKTINDITEINDARSRAWWFEYNNKLYLAHSTNGRNLSEFIEINEARLVNSEIVMQSTIQLIYPCICEYDGNLFISATGNSSTAVYVRKFVMPTINTDIVTNMLLKIMKNYLIN